MIRQKITKNSQFNVGITFVTKSDWVHKNINIYKNAIGYVTLDVLEADSATILCEIKFKK